MTDEEIAQVVHEAMRAFKISLGQDAPEDWQHCPQWMRDSSVAAVQYRKDNPDAPHSAQHDQWMDDKLAHGWTFGEVRDDDAKKHPLLIPYEQLPVIERRKDALVSAVIRALTAPMDA